MDIRVELLMKTTGSFGNWFILDESELDNGRLAPVLDWVDITEDVMSVNTNRGRSRDIDSFQAGTANIEFKNLNRKYDPSNRSSPYQGNIIPMREIRITGIVNDENFRLYRGYVQDWEVDYSHKGIMSTTTARCADAFAILAMQELEEISASHSGDTSGERIERVLDLPEVDFPNDIRNINTGLSIFGDTEFGENALQYLQTCEDSESGSLFVAKDGTLTFVERNNIAPDLTQETSVDLGSEEEANDLLPIVFGDTSDPVEIPYQDITVDFSTDLLYNRIITEGTSGNVQKSFDEDSQEAYQIRTLKRTGQFVSNDDEMQDQADWLIGRFSVPDLRFKDVSTVIDSLSEDKQKKLFSLELARKIEIRKTPPGEGDPATIIQSVVIDGLSFSWTPDRFNCKVRVSGGETVFPFTLNDEFVGILDQNKLGY